MSSARAAAGAPRQQQLWKTNEARAQKHGARKTVYWVKARPPAPAGEGPLPSRKAAALRMGPRYEVAATYRGAWHGDLKHGFGTQVYRSGNRYEGEWADGRREGHGTLFVRRGEKLAKVYAGGWAADKRSGLGVQHYRDGSRYEGEWEAGVRHGAGSMWYANGDVYVGAWRDDRRSGTGTLTYASGDVYEGSWAADRREGAGIYFFAAKDKVLDAEWAADVAKCSVYVDAADFFGANDHPQRPVPGAGRADATGDALLARFRGAGAARHKEPLPELGLAGVDALLAGRVAEIQRERAAARELAEVPLRELFADEEIDLLGDIFDRVAAAAAEAAAAKAAAGAGTDQGEGASDRRVPAADLPTMLADAGFPCGGDDASVARILADLDLGPRAASARLAFADFVRAVHLARGGALASPSTERQE